MALRLDTPRGREALTELLLFRDQVYANRGARWPTFLPLDLPLLMGEGPFAGGRRLHPLVVRDGADIVCRAVAAVDRHFHELWHEPVGHVLFFEALPGARAAVRLLMDAACEWLAAQGMTTARAGFGLFDMPFAVDDYESLPPTILRHSPAYYHALLKDAGFETEQGFVDYRIAVRPELVARWESALAAGRRAGFHIVPLRDVPADERAPIVVDILNDAFRSHWGYVPTTAEEQALVNGMFEPSGFLDTAVIAYEGERAVGQCYVVPEMTAMAATTPGRVIGDAEKLNFLGVGVRRAARGRGLALAMAAYGYLELVRQGAKYLSYTLVLDDNWPSRRTAEKLGAEVSASYVAYRRELRKR
jgi:hypothetical protein